MVVPRLVQKYLLVIGNDNNGGTLDAELVEVHNLSRVRCAQPIFKVNLTCSFFGLVLCVLCINRSDLIKTD